ncbi:DoxX family protein [Nonomuraea sp. MCN248]|uniref:DoxX family protein n=1 Tax=Nonomuraea corallina TaxID=2989783 RepID=A0ABT4SK82_9ACTN|nr:DoxX family protein [Nonomuraea corallina]MDA0637534.1 DoxX family protein [Nonomuraea corallina]
MPEHDDDKEQSDMAKSRNITYWVSTLVLASGLVGSGVQQVLRSEGEGALAPPYAWGIVELGYPVYVLTLLGTWKILGAVAIVAPGYPLVKEWAYAGLGFLLTGGMFSHLASGDPWYQLLPAFFLLVLTVLSWHFRPAGRRLVTAPAG